MMQRNVSNNVSSLKYFVTFSPRFEWLKFYLICTILSLIILWTIIGNVFVVAAILLEKTLKTSSNYLILSLAVADLMVAVLVMPISAVNEVSVAWWLGIELCDIWACMDVLSCTASILHLVVIALDRYCAVTRVQYLLAKRARHRKVIGMLVGVWLLAVLISVPARFHTHRHDDGGGEYQRVLIKGVCRINDSVGYTVFSNLGAFYLPMLFMSGIYLRIYLFTKARIRRRRRQRKTTSHHQDSGPTYTQTSQYTNTSLLNESLSLKNNGMATNSDGDSATLLVIENHHNQGDITNSLNDKSKSCNTISTNQNSVECCVKENKFTISSDWLNDDEVWNELKFVDEDNGEDEKTSIEIKCSIICSKVTKCDEENTTFINRNFNKSSMIERRPSPPVISSDQPSSSTRTPSHAHNNNLGGQSNQKNHHGFNNICHINLHQRQQQKIEQQRERKAARTLAVITGAFILCWLPFGCNNAVRAFGVSTLYLVDSLSLWLGYINSGLNPLIYTVFSPEYRAAFRKILLGKYKNQRHHYHDHRKHHHHHNHHHQNYHPQQRKT